MRGMLAEILRRVARIEQFLSHTGAATMSALDELTAEVQSNTDVIKSAMALINGLATQIEATKGDAVKAEALASQLRASTAALAGAVAANTSAAPPAPAAPPAAPPAHAPPAPAPETTPTATP